MKFPGNRYARAVTLLATCQTGPSMVCCIAFQLLPRACVVFVQSHVCGLLCHAVLPWALDDISLGALTASLHLTSTAVTSDSVAPSFHMSVANVPYPRFSAQVCSHCSATDSFEYERGAPSLHLRYLHESKEERRSPSPTGTTHPY